MPIHLFPVASQIPVAGPLFFSAQPLNLTPAVREEKGETRLYMDVEQGENTEELFFLNLVLHALNVKAGSSQQHQQEESFC